MCLKTMCSSILLTRESRDKIISVKFFALLNPFTAKYFNVHVVPSAKYF